ncbi:hypothetical protein [Desulfonatronum sp. SC1]|uniref:hypothetical protein n=1 Tax=Desulfonatronum sp. SC1 TaxID=2109626 RepID=UPI0011B1EE6C|nr:hypothetical protein [Desulfonatronum sp. SC1]
MDTGLRRYDFNIYRPASSAIPVQVGIQLFFVVFNSPIILQISLAEQFQRYYPWRNNGRITGSIHSSGLSIRLEKEDIEIDFFYQLDFSLFFIFPISAIQQSSSPGNRSRLKMQ